ncbi:MAG TPA: glycine cleavage system protein H [Bryobacteraceae bacterium]|nr:glycine cleavage system protein H [Bryobacteraceae bacterium]
MFPWNYGFHWSAASGIFLGAFYMVLAVVAGTVITALRRSRRRAGAAEPLRWQSDFERLGDRACRHALTGEMEGRTCPHAFDCRKCETHANWVADHPADLPEPLETEILGMPFPLDRFYHRGHTWARPEADGTVTVGLDELGRRLIGTPEAVEAPKPGAHLRANGIAWKIRKRNAAVRVLAPVDGEVVEVGGWELRVKPSKPTEFRHLLAGNDVAPWLRHEMERLQLVLSGEGTPTLADGGMPVTDLEANVPGADWDRIWGEMFLEP